MYAGPEFPPWTGGGPGSPPVEPAPRRIPLSLHLAILLFPLTAGVLTGAAIPLVLACHTEAGWRGLGSATLVALLLAAPVAHLLAKRLLRR